MGVRLYSTHHQYFMGQQQNMLDWNEYRKELTGQLVEFSERNPGPLEGDKALTTAALP